MHSIQKIYIARPTDVSASHHLERREERRRRRASVPDTFIERGDIAEGRRQARVTLGKSLPVEVESYAGYFTVNKTYDSNQFLWYFPSQAQDNGTSPVLVWMNGGPGASSLYGLFKENGPFEVINKKIQLRKYHWAQNHHLIYIDNPVGTGFSFTKNRRGYCTDQTQIGEQLYSTMTQFFKLFPELQKNKFFVSGESYAGKYVPALAYTIHKKNPTAETKINLQGIAIGDGWCDPEHHFVYSQFLYQVGLVDWNAKEQIEEYEADAVKYVKNQDWDNAFDAWYMMLNYVDRSMKYNFINQNELEDFSSVLKSDTVRKAIHVGNNEFNLISDDVYYYLTQDMMKSIAPWIVELLDHYSVVTYNGQLDVIVAYPLTVNFLRNLKFSGADEYARAERHPWMVGDEVAGYVKQAGRLTELLVRNAGHMVPEDQPAWAWDMITRITHGQPFY
ncbi:hypothetical protein MSG28_005552 [Choristoneura fumiferana]|uniref:Uncharacterized protein n=1 Tax=Choristoneura fumiferana TaxID=7141 RepID=A0ACC0KZF5_CHOFU|nr:hypothetical protein MSG28_005552 [Choristoneura fumiferana]